VPDAAGPNRNDVEPRTLTSCYQEQRHTGWLTAARRGGVFRAKNGSLSFQRLPD
jgi:hypothetical protein